MDQLLPVLIVVGVYGAASWFLTLWIRKTLARYAPSVECWLSRVEIAKRLLPCMVAFVLLSASPSSMLIWFGLTIDDPSEFWSVAWMLAIFAGIFSGYAHHWLRDVYRGKRSGSSKSDVPPDADAP